MKRIILPLPIFEMNIQIYLGGDSSEFLKTVSELDWIKEEDLEDAQGWCALCNGTIIVWAADNIILIHELTHAATNIVDHIEGDQGSKTADEVRAYATEWMWKEINDAISNSRHNTWDSGQGSWDN